MLIVVGVRIMQIHQLILDIFDPTSGPTLLGALGVAPGTDNPVIKQLD